jgi:hypothetical protein
MMYILKGQSNEIFRLPFFIKRLILVSIAISNFVEFSWIYLYLKYLKNWLPAVIESGESKIKP